MDIFDYRWLVSGFVILLYSYMIFFAIPTALKTYAMWKQTKQDARLTILFSNIFFIFFVCFISLSLFLRKVWLMENFNFNGPIPPILYGLAPVIAYGFFAPRAVRHFLSWKESREASQFIAFFVYGLITLFLLSAICAVTLKVLIHSPYLF